MVALLLVIATSGGLLLLPRTDDGLLGLPELQAGEASPRTIKSPAEVMVTDPQTSAQLRARAAAEVLPTYDQLPWMGDTIKHRIEAAFRAVPAAPNPGLKAEAFMLELRVTIDQKQLLPIITAEHLDELRDAMIMVVQTIYEAPVVQDRPYLRLQSNPEGVLVRIMAGEGKPQDEHRLQSLKGVLGIDQARARVDEVVAERLQRLKMPQRRAVAGVLKRLLRPNLVPNEAETERRRRVRAESVPPVVLVKQRGDVIVRAGERVSREQQLLLSQLEKDLDAQSRLQAGAGSSLLMVFLVIFSYRIARRSYRPRPRHRDLTFLAASFVLMLLMLWVSFKGVIYLTDGLGLLSPEAARFLVPVAVGALVVRLVAGVEAAAMFSPVVGLAAGWMMDGSLAFAAYAMLGSLGAASAADAESPRTMVWWGCLRVCLAQVVAVVAVALQASLFDVQAVLPSVGAALVSGLMTAVAAALLLPLVELLFGFTTANRLNDLANLNHPLLRELLLEAPGTYHHSILVGDMAEAGAESIGAHRLLARVGGYYHDVGKIKNARLFVENDPNSFPGLYPEEHAQQLRAHVSDGLELAAEHRLGAPVMQIIAQHHGASLVRTAYARAVQRSGEGVDDELFRYPGPRPVAREVALVLLADVVETATRSLGTQVGVTRATVEAQVRHVITEVLEDGQLDRCEITLKDLGQIVAAFTRVLEDRLVRHGRPPTLSSLPALPSMPLVPPPPRGEPN